MVVGRTIEVNVEGNGAIAIARNEFLDEMGANVTNSAGHDDALYGRSSGW